MRRLRRIILWTFALLIVVGGALLFYVLHSPSELERYIGNQVQAIVNRQLKPQLSFENLRYEYPATVHLENLKLTAEDPANPGKTIDIVAADSGTLTLAKIPRVGEPIQIERITLQKPSLQLISMGPNNPDLCGFSDILKEKPASKPTTKEKEDTFSDILQIRLIQIADGKVVYDPRIPGTEAMTLDQVNTQVDFTPTEAGWYAFKLGINRRPLFTLVAGTQINLDTFQLRDINVTLKAKLEDEDMTYLPPQVQRELQKYQVRGRIDAVANGELPITQPEKAKLGLSVDLRKAHAVLGEYEMPIERFTSQVNFFDNTLQVTSAELNGFSGTASVTGTLGLDEALTSDLTIKVNQMKIQDIFASKDASNPSTLTGLLSVDAWLRGPLQSIIDRAGGAATPALPKSWASGIVRIQDGRLMNFALIRRILSAIGITQISNTDSATIAADCGGDTVAINDIKYVGKLLAARGSGTIKLDRTMDLWINAGPIERAQVLLGSVGSVIGKVTDNIVAYRVRGTVDDPKITVEVGNGSVNKVGGFLGGMGSDIGGIFKK